MKRFEPKVTETLDDSLSPASNRAVNEKLKAKLVYSSNNGKIYKVGNLYTIHFEGFTIGGTFLIPAEYRPSVTKRATVLDTNTSLLVDVDIRTDGTLLFSKLTGSTVTLTSGTIYGDAFYIL